MLTAIQIAAKKAPSTTAHFLARHTATQSGRQNIDATKDHVPIIFKDVLDQGAFEIKTVSKAASGMQSRIISVDFFKLPGTEMTLISLKSHAPQVLVNERLKTLN